MAADLPGPPGLPRAGPYPWDHVLARHGGRRGIRLLPDGRLSLLLDYGLSAYRNFWDGDTLHYLGERGRDGRFGAALPGNVRLRAAAQVRETARVWERLRPGVWYDLGQLRVVDVRTETTGGHEVLVFHLRR